MIPVMILMMIMSWCTADPAVRLLNGTSSCSGRVEVFTKSEWKRVCDINWDMKDAMVVCRQLGCGNAIAVPYRPGQEHGGKSISNVKCSGNEYTLDECLLNGYGDGFYHCYDASVVCSAFVRLVDGAPLCSGRVEVKSNQSWASVCEADFDWQDAEVVCRELGCGAPSVLQGGLYGEGERLIWAKEFQCKGDESLLLDCDTLSRKEHTCTPGNDVGLTCIDRTRLLQGGGRCAGAVQLYLFGDWVTLMDTEWDITQAAVVCRQLGCGSAISAPGGFLFGNGTGQVVRGSIPCIGSEWSLFECQPIFTSPTSSCCSNAGVICSDLLQKPDISLADSMGGVSKGHQGPEVFRGHSFTITCSIQPHYPGGSFLLTFIGSNRTQTQPAVNHSSAFLFPAADDSHQGNYSCVYEIYIFSNHFSSESELLSLTVTVSLLTTASSIRVTMVLLAIMTITTAIVIYSLICLYFTNLPCIPALSDREEREQLREYEQDEWLETTV